MKHRDFRLLWLATLGTGAGWWMDTVTRGWLIYELTGSATQLGLVSATRAVPFLAFGLIAGIAADRWNRQVQLQISQAMSLSLNLLLALLVATGTVEIWHVYATAFFMGISQAFMQPARQSMIPTLVPRSDLMNAVALSSGAFSITKSLGPAVAGLLIASVSLVGAYLVQAALYLWALTSLTRLDAPEPPRSDKQQSMAEDLRAGLSYVRGDVAIFTLLLLALVPAVLGQPYYFLLPMVAGSVLQAGPTGLGLLGTAPGIGSLLAIVALAMAGDFPRKGTLMIAGAVAFGLGLMAFSQSHWLPLSFVLLVCVGVAQNGYNALNMTLLQKLTPDGFRGRVLSLLLLDRGMVPLGAATIGVLGDVWGPQEAIFTMGSACALIALIVAVRVPRIHTLE
jgi:MFS family permease